MAYMTPLRRTVAMRPVRASFLLMWAPLPTSTLPLIAGFLIPPSELSLFSFVRGATRPRSPPPPASPPKPHHQP